MHRPFPFEPLNGLNLTPPHMRKFPFTQNHLQFMNETFNTISFTLSVLTKDFINEVILNSRKFVNLNLHNPNEP